MSQLGFGCSWQGLPGLGSRTGVVLALLHVSLIFLEPVHCLGTSFLMVLAEGHQRALIQSLCVMYANILLPKANNSLSRVNEVGSILCPLLEETPRIRMQRGGNTENKSPIYFRFRKGNLSALSEDLQKDT